MQWKHSQETKSSPDTLQLGHSAQDPYTLTENTQLKSFLVPPPFPRYELSPCVTCQQLGYSQDQCPTTHIHCLTCDSSNHNMAQCKGKPCTYCQEWGHFWRLCPSTWKCINCNSVTYVTNDYPELCAVCGPSALSCTHCVTLYKSW